MNAPEVFALKAQLAEQQLRAEAAEHELTKQVLWKTQAIGEYGAAAMRATAAEAKLERIRALPEWGRIGAEDSVRAWAAVQQLLS